MTMSWPRAITLAICLHLLFFISLVYSLKGTVSSFAVDITFLGAILNPQEIAPLKVFSPAPQEFDIAGLFSETKFPLGHWQQGIQLDKPEDIHRDPTLPDSRILRFVGPRGSLDQEISGTAIHDIPAVERVDLHAVRP